MMNHLVSCSRYFFPSNFFMTVLKAFRNVFHSLSDNLYLSYYRTFFNLLEINFSLDKPFEKSSIALILSKTCSINTESSLEVILF